MGIVAAGLGLLVGLALGLLGGGGSVLAVPSLVYILGESPHEATTGSLIIIIASSLSGVAAHARAGRVQVRAGLGFGLAGLATSIISAALSKGLPETVVLVGFAGVMLTAAAMMWRSAKALDHGPVPGRQGTGGLRTILAGAGVGVLIGVFGVGGGFLAVPALVAVAGFTMPNAVGTSLLIIALNSSAALATRVAGSHVDWAVILPFAAAASVAAVVGQRASSRFRAATLQQTFAGLLVLLAGWVLLDQLVLHTSSN
ncbi:sulfite exporter TauE/SafE family protein [Knoellia koreensis]|uniref:Probable membrane transporter protein n=1 Tax=Knoellia koreensis TaxID=2730921 RepID=A0A849HQY8_9MICO|nr:sulfite exporter TauE/SafE family protein [Knoellia sp. DB2414S]NNM47017.1 sulfite exporter TauE/SafE family protein [Knoellia sp. DB2414S]